MGDHYWVTPITYFFENIEIFEKSDEKTKNLMGF